MTSPFQALVSNKSMVQRTVVVNTVYINLLCDPEVTANLYCNFAYQYWEGCVICSIYLR